MIRAIPSRTKAAIIIACLALGGYLASYFATTEIFKGQIQNTNMDFRLFNSPSHRTVFLPLILLEEKFRSGEKIEFYGHIKNGASLPPARDTTALSQEN